MQESLVRNDYKPEEILNAVHYHKGLLWDKISAFTKHLSSLDNAATHKLGKPQEKLMREYYPLKHKFEGGLYTREIFMPKGHVTVSFIHKQQHPSFLMEGKVSFINDEGRIETISAPKTVFTQVGTQRIFFIHEDTKWVCVYKTNATNVEEAEKEIYASSYKQLPQKIINKAIQLCQE